MSPLPEFSLVNNVKNEDDCFKQMALMLEKENEHETMSIDEILRFLNKAGLILVPKIRSLIVWCLNRAKNKQILRAVVKAPRGGGKTFSIAGGIEFVLFYFFNYDCVNLGGSKAQATKANEIVQDFTQDPDVEKQIQNTIHNRTTKKNGTWIQVLATAGTSVRSPHPGNSNKGGLLFIDEECEIKDPRIVKSAKPVVNSASPSAIIRASTQHRLDDSFEDVWDNAKEQGYTRFSWDIFDVCEHCTRKCWLSIKDDPDQGCYDRLRLDKYDSHGEVIEEGYCKGRARHDGWKFIRTSEGKWKKQYNRRWDWHGFKGGWIRIVEILQDYIENDSETFEVEYLGRKAKRKGKVYPGDCIEMAQMDSCDLSQAVLRRAEKSIGIDWGFNECCITYSFRYKKEIYLYWIEYYKHTSIGYTLDEINERIKFDNHEEAYCDAEGAYENEQLSDDCFVYTVPFQVWKDFGIHSFRNLLEKERVHFLRTWKGQVVPGFDRFIKQMKDYRFDEHGNYVKKNDHGPDSGMCNLLKWAPRRKQLKGKRNALQGGTPTMHVV